MVDFKFRLKADKPCHVLTSPPLSIVLDDSPTSNCQLFSVAGFDQVVRYAYNNQKQSIKKTIGDFIKQAVNAVGKPIMMIDINQEEIYDSIELSLKDYLDLDPQYIIIQQEYESTNNSTMTLILYNAGLFYSLNP